MDELIQLIVKSYGIIGVIILSPMVATVYLWKENTKLHSDMIALTGKHADKLDDAGTRVTAAQDKRIADAQGITTKLMEMVSAQSALNKETNITLDRVGDMVSMLLNDKRASK
jgi:hypothetical protein